MSGLRIQNYMLSFEPVNLVAPGLTAELIDQFRGTRTAISLTDSSFYNFSATNDPASRAINRFYLVFKAPAAPVPVKFVSITASRNTDRSIKVNWAVVNEINISHYEIERSENGINPVAEAGTRAVAFYAKVPNPQLTLKAGLFVQGRLAVSDSETGLVIPNAAIRYDEQKQPYVWTLAQQKLVKQVVSLGTSCGLAKK